MIWTTVLRLSSQNVGARVAEWLDSPRSMKNASTRLLHYKFDTFRIMPLLFLTRISRTIAVREITIVGILLFSLQCCYAPIIRRANLYSQEVTLEGESRVICFYRQSRSLPVSPSSSRRYALQCPESVRGHVTKPLFLAKGILAPPING